MILSKIENVKPEQKLINDSAADNLQVSPAIGNTNVVRCFWLGAKCPRCEFGRVYPHHSEPHGWTTIEIYKCDKCFTEFI